MPASAAGLHTAIEFACFVTAFILKISHKILPHHTLKSLHAAIATTKDLTGAIAVRRRGCARLHAVASAFDREQLRRRLAASELARGLLRACHLGSWRARVQQRAHIIRRDARKHAGADAVQGA